MGDDKKKSGGKKGGTFRKLLILAVLVLIGAEVASRLLSQAEWSPLIRIQKLIKGQS